jgi:hypothetical protein
VLEGVVDLRVEIFNLETGMLFRDHENLMIVRTYIGSICTTLR